MYSIYGVNTDSDVEVKTHIRENIRPFANAGGSVIGLDHVVKSEISRDGNAIGAQAKTGSVDLALTLVAITEFAPGRRGQLGIDIRKDRFGAVKSAATRGGNSLLRWCEMTVSSTGIGERVDISLDPVPENAARTANTEMESKILTALRGSDSGSGMSTNSLEKAVKGNSTIFRNCLNSMKAEGKIESRSGKHNANNWFLPGAPSQLALSE
jgi:hypothetical protein